MPKYKVSLFLLVLNIINFIMATNFNNSSGWPICKSHGFRGCNCTNQKTARCYVSHVADIEKHVIQPDWFLQLDLSGNGIQFIPKKKFSNFSNLLHLSLANNSIRTVSIRAFYGLARLRELNLRDNTIKVWDTTSIRQDLPSLSLLNVARNMYWKPDHNILSLPNLKVIYLLLEVTTHKFKSFRCYLVQENFTINQGHSWYIEQLPSNIKEKVKPSSLLDDDPDRCSFYDNLVFHDTSYWDVIQENGFYFHCEYITSKLSINQKPLQKGSWYNIKVFFRSYCWETTNKIYIITLLIALLTMFFNLIVVATTLRSRALRESVAHVLVANIAVGDLLVSFYLIILISTRQSVSSMYFESIRLPVFCRIVGPLLITGQFLSSLLSFVMTLERYLAVVYCMKPHIRITMTTCYVALVTIWSFCLSIAISFMTFKEFSISTDLVCVPMSNINNFPVIIVFGGIGVLLYILSIALYGHMYFDFKRTNQKTVQLQRENRLARRIALIIFTNVFFILLPLITIGTVSILVERFFEFKREIIFWDTFGITCLGINSCLNPILFSFRNELFRQELRKQCCICKNSVDVP